MATEHMQSSTVNLRLNVGANDRGGMIIRAVSLGRLWGDADAAKILGVVGALLPVLEFPMFRVERRTTTVIEP